MRDYVAWYLIELRRRLTSVDPQQKVEDFILETRTHLQESVDDMTARGIAEEDATKAAITDFGHPSLVAAAFRGRRHMSPRTYWVLIGIAFLSAVPALVQVVSSATDNALGYPHMTTFEFGMACIGIFSVIALIGFFSRRWCAVPLVAGALALTIAVSGWFLNRTNPYAMEDDSERFVLLGSRAAQGQIEVRQQWLDQYDEAVPKIAEAIKPTGDGEQLLKLVESEYNGYLIPAGTGQRSYRMYMSYPTDIPGTPESRSGPYWNRWISIEESDVPPFYVAQNGDRTTALGAWRKEGPAYLEHLKQERARVSREIERFKAPASIARGDVVSRLLWFPLTVVALMSLLGLALNGVAIMFSDATVSLRRLRWKRRFN